MANGDSGLWSSIEKYLPIVAGGAIGALAGGGPGALAGASGAATGEEQSQALGQGKQERLLNALSLIQSRKAAQEQKQAEMEIKEQELNISKGNQAIRNLLAQSTIQQRAGQADNNKFNQQMKLMDFGLGQERVKLEAENIGNEAGYRNAMLGFEKARLGLEELSKGNQYLTPETFQSWLGSQSKDVQDEGSKLTGSPKAMTMFFESHTNARMQNMQMALDHDVDRLTSFTGWDRDESKNYLSTADGKRRSSTVDAILNGTISVKSPSDLPAAFLDDGKADAKARETLAKDAEKGWNAYNKVPAPERLFGMSGTGVGPGEYVWQKLTPAAVAGLNPKQQQDLHNRIVKYMTGNSNPDFKFLARMSYPTDVAERAKARTGTAKTGTAGGATSKSGRPIKQDSTGKWVYAD